MPYYKRADGSVELIAGFVGMIGPPTNPIYFTGSGYSASIDDAKIFRTSRGCFSAMRYWNEADYNQNGPMNDQWWNGRRAKPVRFTPLLWEIVPNIGSKW